MRLEQEYQEPFKAWQADPTPATSGAMLRSMSPIFTSATRRYGGASANSPTLRSQARALGLDALQSYDPERGPLRPHIMSHLQRLRRSAAEEQQIISVPEQVRLDRIHTDGAGRELEDQLGRPPSDRELANHTGLSLKRLQHIRKARRPIAEGTITQTTDDGTGGYDPATTSLETNPVDPWVEFIYEELSPTDQFILERSMGLHGHPAVAASEVARQLKLSPGAISQRMQRIQGLLDSRDELGGF